MTIQILSILKDFTGTNLLKMVNSMDCATHQKKVPQCFFHPIKYKAEMEEEQKKHSGKCIITDPSLVMCLNAMSKKNAKILAGNKDCVPSAATLNSSGQLHHIKEEVFENAVPDTHDDAMLDSSNDTN